MVGKRKNRWFRRWLVVIVFWLVPVLIIAVREAQDEMTYNQAELQRGLTNWTFTDAERAAGAPQHCQGTPDEARALGCPAAVLAANAAAHQTALDEYAMRRAALVSYLWHAFVGYWIVPAATLFAIGVLLAGVKRALRRPPSTKPVKPVKPVPER